MANGSSGLAQAVARNDLGVIRPWLALAAAVCALACGCDSGSPPGPPPPVRLYSLGSTSAPSRAPAHSVTGPAVSGSDPYTFDLLDGAKTVQVQSADLDGRLYEVHTLSGTTAFPVVTLADHTVRVALQGGGNADLFVVLDRSTPWSLTFSEGVSTASVDMAAGSLRAFSALQGISTIDVTAGKPTGNVIMTEASGVSAFALHVPAATPVTVNAHAGAGTVSLFGQTHSGVTAGATFSSGTGSDRYTIEAQGGVSNLTVAATG